MPVKHYNGDTGRTSADTYRFRDLLALARATWLAQRVAASGECGYLGYRGTDAWVTRRLLAITQVGPLLGITRQAGRKIIDGLLDRGYAATEPDTQDRRRVNVILTPAGHVYAAAVDEDAQLLVDRWIPPPPPQ